MKLTLSWLKSHLETEASLPEIVDRLTMLGLEVDAVVNRAAGLEAFTVARVVEAKQHPNADRLRVCTVDTGTGTVQVVCGAPNARTGMIGVFAPPGTRIPGTGIDLKAGVIRGVESNGMLLSERELGLSDEHEGIVELAVEAPVGTPYATVAGLDDPMLDVKITPNRADCLGVRGIARDLAAAGLGRLKPLDTAAVPGTFKSPIGWSVELPPEAADLVPLVVGRYFRNVRNVESPAWLRDRLTAIGLRPISALVDITNYVMMDLGRPLHAYDADKVDGDVVIRLARAGESYGALNGREYAFDEDMLVIGDRRGPDDLAGIMGGEKTGCGEDTRNMFLEAAIFDPINVATTGRRLNLQSDARYRFERGLDPTGPFWGTEVATRLILEICGGEASELVVHGAEPGWRRTYPLRWSRIRGLAGVEVPQADAKRILADLGFTATADTADGLMVQPPPWRGDVIGEADLVEEVARIWGYERIPVVPLPRESVMPPPARTLGQTRVAFAKRFLAGRGMLEAVTFSFMPAAEAELFGGGGTAMRLVNPIASDLDQMRPSILPNLIAAARRNADRGHPDQALFEVGPEYVDTTPTGQRTVAAGIRSGRTGPRDWLKESRPVDLFDAKADALALLEALGAPVANLQTTRDAPDWYHPGRSGALRLGPTVLARFGELHPRTVARLDAKGPMVAFEVMLDAVPQPKGRAGPARPLLRPSPFQPVGRDFAFLVDREVAADRLVRAARGADKALVADVQVFDVYEGAGLPDGKKSIAIAVTLQPVERTLGEEDLAAVSARIVAAVEKQTGGVIRS